MSLPTASRSQQVKEYLLNYISQNHLKRNDQLPSEASIAKTLGVSRNTIREAYIILENDGVIVRRHGIGTFVAHAPVIQDPLNEFSPFAEIIQNGGYTPNFQTISMEEKPASTQVYDALDVSEPVDLLRIRRLVLADKLPVILVDDYLAPLVKEAGLDWDAFEGDMVRFLASSLNIQLHQIRSRIRAASVESNLAEYLDLPAGTPVLSVSSTIFAIDNQPIAFSNILFNSNIVELNTVRTIRSP